MELVSPSIGLVFWTLVAFLALLILLKKYAWKPILAAIHQRERSIETALSAAENAKEELKQLVNENEQLLQKARVERDLILKEARGLKEQIINDAKKQSHVEAKKLLDEAKHEINAQRLAALDAMKRQIATLALEIAEKMLQQELADRTKQEAFVHRLLEEANLDLR